MVTPGSLLVCKAAAIGSVLSLGGVFAIETAIDTLSTKDLPMWFTLLERFGSLIIVAGVIWAAFMVAFPKLLAQQAEERAAHALERKDYLENMKAIREQGAVLSMKLAEAHEHTMKAVVEGFGTEIKQLREQCVGHRVRLEKSNV